MRVAMLNPESIYFRSQSSWIAYGAILATVQQIKTRVSRNL